MKPNQLQKGETYATLKDGTPFEQVFPSKKVPIISLVPIIPREHGAPPCYVVNGGLLTDAQKAALAESLYQMWKPECTSPQMALDCINKGLPLKCDWFNSVTTTNFGQFMNLAT